MGSSTWSVTFPATSGVQDGTGECDPMPPVFGPRSPSCARLKSCAACIASTVFPSEKASTDSSSPSSRSSTRTLLPAAPNTPRSRASVMAAAAWVSSSHTVTPLPAARPSAFTTAPVPCAMSRRA